MRLFFLFFYSFYRMITACVSFYLLKKVDKNTRLQRKGIPDFTGKISVWFHVASVGEVRLIATLKDYYNFAGSLITVMTVTGLKTAKELFPECRVMLVPFDTVSYMRRFIQTVRPEKIVLFETEIWPCMIVEAKRAGVPLYLFHGRISDRSFPKYLVLRSFLRTLLLCFDGVYARCSEDAERLFRLGAKVYNVPSLKIPVVQPDSDILSWLNPGSRKIVVAGSVHPEETEKLLKGFNPEEFVLIIAPRHLERIPEFIFVFEKMGFSYCALSEKKEADIIIADSMGMLMKLYSCADYAFVGGSFAPVGGHNMMEPAVYGIPVFFGEHVFNFRFQARYLVKHQIGIQTENIWDSIKTFSVSPDILQNAQNKINRLYGKDSRFYAQVLNSVPKKRRYLAFRMSALGDCILLAPVLQKLLEHADIKIITKSQFAWIFEQYGIDTIPCSSYSDIFNAVKNSHYDAFLDFHGNGRSLFASLFFPVVIRYKKHGFKRRIACNSFFRRFSGEYFSVYQEYAQVCRKLCADFKLPELKQTDSENIIVICPGASSLEKAAPEAIFISAVKYFSDRGYNIIFCGSDLESDICEQIIQKSGVICENKAGKTTAEEMFQIIRKCSAFIGNDSGPMHIAEVFNKPLLAFFGPTAQQFGFYPVNNQAMIAEKPVSCRPCSIHGNVPCRMPKKLCMQYSEQELLILFDKLYKMVCS